jgi:hypothetical protein
MLRSAEGHADSQILLADMLWANYQNNFYNEFDKQNPDTDFYENIIEFSVGANFKINKNFIQLYKY